jgi:hypothetical protein
VEEYAAPNTPIEDDVALRKRITMARAPLLTIVAIVAALSFGTGMMIRAGTAATTEPLFDVALDAIPTESAAATVLRWTLQPNPQPLVVPAPGGPVVLVVETGQLTAAQNGTRTPLLAGQHFAPADPDHDIALHVSGPEIARVLVVSVTESRCSQPKCYGRDMGLHTAEVLILGPAGALPSASGRLILERLLLPSGVSLPPRAVSPLVWRGIASGVLGLTLAGQMPFTWTPGQERTLWPGQPWPPMAGPAANPLIAEGTRMKLRNAGSDPLILYQLTLVPPAGTVIPAA